MLSYIVLHVRACELNFASVTVSMLQCSLHACVCAMVYDVYRGERECPGRGREREKGGEREKEIGEYVCIIEWRTHVINDCSTLL